MELKPSTLSQKALLVSICISQWTGRKLDRKATADVEKNFETEKSVGNYHKKLLPGAHELDAINTQANQTRRWLLEQTLPWMTDGTRILSSKNYMGFMSEFRKRANKFDETVERFLQVYVALRVGAKLKLGQLYVDSEYPTVEKLRTCFKCSVLLFPMPEVTDFRTEVLDSEKEAFMGHLKDVQSRALSELFTRLKDVVSRAADRLNKPDAVIRTGLMNSITEICDLIPKLNVYDSPDLESARREIEKVVSGVSVETLRTNPDERKSTAEKLAEIDAKLKGFIG
jgi:hypothetical protein